MLKRLVIILFLLCGLAVYAVPEAETATDNADSQLSATSEEADAAVEQHKYAQGLLKRKFYDLALPELEHLKSEYPNHALNREWDLMIINCHWGMKQYAVTLETIDDFEERWGKEAVSEHIQLVRGISQYNLGNYEAAIIALDNLQENSEATADLAQYYSAMASFELQRPEDGIAKLEKLISGGFPANAPYRWNGGNRLANEYIRLGRYDEAAELLVKLKASPAADQKCCCEISLQLGNLYFNRSDYQWASYWFEDYCQSAEPDAKNAFIALRSVNCQLLLENWQVAYDLCNRWLKRFPQECPADIYVCQATAAERLCDFENALSLWNKAAEFPQIGTVANYHVLCCLMHLDKNEEFLEKSQAFLASNPDDAQKGQLLFDMGNVYSKIGNKPAAVEHWRLALDNLENQGELFFMAGDNLVKEYSALNQYADAAEISRRLAYAPGCSSPDSWLYNSAISLQRAGDDNAAIIAFQKALEFPATDDNVTYRILFNMAVLLQKNQDYETLLTYLPRLIELAPDDKKASFSCWQATLLTKKGDYDAAVATLEKLPRLDLKSLELMLKLQIRRDNLTAVTKYAGEYEKFIVAYPEPSQIDFGIILTVGRFFISYKKPESAEVIWNFAIEHCADKKIFDAILGDYCEYMNGNGQSQRSIALLQKRLDFLEVAGEKHHQRLSSLLAEAYLAQKKYQPALLYADDALKSGTASDSQKDFSRACYVKAVVLYEYQAAYSDAASFAIRCYVQGNVPEYSGISMELAAKCYEKIGENERAAQIRKEMARETNEAPAESVN